MSRGFFVFFFLVLLTRDFLMVLQVMIAYRVVPVTYGIVFLKPLSNVRFDVSIVLRCDVERLAHQLAAKIALLDNHLA